MGYRDPEVVYGRMTSGDVGRIIEVADTLAAGMTSLDDAATSVDRGMASATAGWQGRAADGFLDHARRTNKAIEVTTARLARVAAAVRRAARAYDAMTGAAADIVQVWRDRPADADEERLAELATRVNSRLRETRDDYELRLHACLGSLDGLIDRSIFGRIAELLGLRDGPVIPHTLQTGDSVNGWVPQGLAYDPRHDLLLTSYYRGEGEDSLLSLIDENSGEEVGNVSLHGLEPPAGPPAPRYPWDIDDEPDHRYAPPNHSGGVAVNGNDVWVTSTEDGGERSYVYRYSLRDLRSAGDGGPVHALDKIEVGASAYATFAEGRLWVGSFEKDQRGKLYGYDVNASGDVDTSSYVEHDTPDRAQGVVVRPDQFIYSQSYRRENPSHLVTEYRDDAAGRDAPDPYRLPNMAEGIVEVDGDVITLYESGADRYSNEEARAAEPDIWPRERMTRTPVEELTGDGAGYDVDPAALTDAAGSFDESAATVGDLAALLSRTQLVPSALGTVPAAKPFAAAVTAAVATMGESMTEGARSVRDTADDLVAAAEDYRVAEDLTATLFDRFRLP